MFEHSKEGRVKTMKREILKRWLSVLLVLMLCLGTAAPLRAQAMDQYYSGLVSGEIVADTVEYWSMDALDRGEMRDLLNKQTLYPQRTGWVELDKEIEKILSKAGSSTYEKLWYAYDWLVQNVEYSWDGYSNTYASVASYNSFSRDYLKKLTYEDGLKKSIPDDMANRTYHVLTAKKGVCYDYGIAMAVIARFIGIESYVHCGKFEMEYAYSGPPHHGWAVLILDGGKYVFDAQRDCRNWRMTQKDVGYYFGVPEAKAWRYEPNKFEADRIANAERDAQMLPMTALRGPEYTVTLVSTGSGTVSGAGKYDVTQTVTVTAAPSAGNTFAGWYNGKTKVSDSASYSFSPTADITLTALFSGDYFIDVPVNAWYREIAVKSAALGLVKGNGSDVIFDGKGTFTRAMAITLIARMDGADIEKAPKASFSDVSAGKWYAAYVNWAYSTGVAEGISSTQFAPDKEITRQGFMAMLERYITLKGVEVKGGSLPFKDSGDTASWAKASLEKFYARGLVVGDTTGRLLPQKSLTRAEGATFVVRTLEYLKDHGKL